MMYIYIYKDLPIYVSNNNKNLKEETLFEYDRIEEVEFAEMYNGIIYTDKEQLKLAKKENIRTKRNNMLKSSDEWGISDREQTEEVLSHKKWRLYLRNYTKQENWWEQNPLSFDEWKESFAE